MPQWPLWLRHRRSLRALRADLDHGDDPARLRHLDRPVLLVSGTDDAPVQRRVHDALLGALPRARLAEMPDGHAPHLVSTDRFLAELDAFLGGVDA